MSVCIGYILQWWLKSAQLSPLLSCRITMNSHPKPYTQTPDEANMFCANDVISFRTKRQKHDIWLHNLRCICDASVDVVCYSCKAAILATVAFAKHCSGCNADNDPVVCYSCMEAQACFCCTTGYFSAANFWLGCLKTQYRAEDLYACCNVCCKAIVLLLHSTFCATNWALLHYYKQHRVAA